MEGEGVELLAEELSEAAFVIADAFGLVFGDIPEKFLGHICVFIEELAKFFMFKDDHAGFFFADGAFGGIFLVEEFDIAEVIA